MVAEQAADVIVVGAGPAGSTRGVLPGPGRAGRAAAGEDDLPAGEGVRRRADPARRAQPDRHGHRRTDEKDGWIRNKGLRVIGGGHAAGAALAGAGLLAGLRPGPAAARLRRDAGPARREGRRPAARAGHGDRPGARPRPAGWSGVEAAHAPDGPATFYRRRWCWPPTGCPAGSRSRSASRKRDDRPMGVAVRRYYTSPRTTTTTWSPGWSSGTTQPDGSRILLPGYGWIFGMGDGTANVGLGMLNSSAAFGTTDYRGAAAPLAGRHAGGVGLREENATGPIRGGGAADGLQPHPALLPRAAAGRRLRRRGQPVQRRGHRVRDGDRAAGRRARRAGAGPAGRARPGAGAGGYPAALRGDLRRLLPARRGVREADRQPAGHAASPPSTACPARC